MSCCHCQDIEGFFTERVASRELRKYRRKGASGPTRVLIDALVDDGVAEVSVLDIGGGIGAIGHELLEAGASHATCVEASAAYLAAAREEAERRGHGARVVFHHGDFVELAPSVGRADVVTLDRVVCCYPDMPALVEASARGANQRYALVYPRERRWIKVGFAAVNVAQRLRRSAFRVYVHPVAGIDAAVSASGLRAAHRRRAGLLWQVVVYARDDAIAGRIAA